MKSILVVSASLCLSYAFQLVALRQPFRRTLIVLDSARSKKQKTEPQNIDWKRAKHCAEHFGACDVTEVEELYDYAHKERIQHNLFGGGDLQHDSTDDIEHRIIEEELELQLGLLQEEHRLANQEVQLFPEEMITDLPHLHEHADAEHKIPIAEKVIHEAEHQLIVSETTMGEDTLETLAMCAVVMGLVLLPQLFN